ncbi:UDP-glycosyltransferase 74E2-like isoform X2 [Cucurbita moschata]|uniref:Mogroside I-E synthase n=1 Tax=Cucurbita moschata TaxID=3662 RepID=A0A6J1EIQ3_CUCMO|nr:UDP-glycosyltransferase 74E2-like isoform X2 [Cucurbita moschata]
MGSLQEKETPKLHVVVVSCHAQGHINPLLQFAKHLAHVGLQVTLPVISSSSDHHYRHLPRSLTVDHVPLLPYQGAETETETVLALWERRKESMGVYLKELMRCHEDGSKRISCVVYDSVISWVLDIVKGFGVMGAAFFTQSCAVNSIYYSVYKHWVSVPLDKGWICVDGFPLFEALDLPSFVADQGKYPGFLQHLADEQFQRLNEADWIFANTFDALEPQEVKWMESHFPFKNIGPMLPSIYLDGRIPNDKDYGVSLFEPNKSSSMKWLDSKPENSVVYVSFGSTAELGKPQMEELAEGLKLSTKSFLWVVRESELHKLPPKFIDETAEKGLVVKWCPQLQVLSHKSVGCFVTHCGWNSTLEALSLGVGLVAMAQWSDQPTNAKYVEDVWKVGKRVRMEEDGVCKREEIEVCINEVMEGGGQSRHG